MADSFGLKLGIEGEKEFKKSLAEINQCFKVLGSEMMHKSRRLKPCDRRVQMHQSPLVKPTEEHKAGKFSLTMPRHHSTVWSVN